MHKKKFSYINLEKIIKLALKHNYELQTLQEFYKKPNKYKKFIIRLDLDFYPSSLKGLLIIADKYKIKFNIFIRVSGNYNLLWYENFRILKSAEEKGHSIGLHSNFVEWSKINNFNKTKLLNTEISLLRSLFKKIDTFAPHRDLNYIYNSLPWTEKNWSFFKKNKFKFHAYNKIFMENCVYVNEGFNPHLGWRKYSPEEIIKSNKSIYLLLHPHWWYDEHPYEHS